MPQTRQPGVADSNVNPGQMRTFVLRARAAPTDSRKLLASVGQEAHTEILAHTPMSAIFVAQSHRPDLTVSLVLANKRDFSRTIRSIGRQSCWEKVCPYV